MTDTPLTKNGQLTLKNRTEWMAQHPCPCGEPSTIIRGRNGTIPKVWTSSAERRTALLSAMEIDYYCGACLLKVRYDQHQAYLAKRRAKECALRRAAGILPKTFREERERRVREPKQLKVVVPKKERESKPLPLFTDTHSCPQCGTIFTRYALLVRHRRRDHAA